MKDIFLKDPGAFCFEMESSRTAVPLPPGLYGGVGVNFSECLDLNKTTYCPEERRKFAFPLNKAS
jgi:hypothetical protein